MLDCFQGCMSTKRNVSFRTGSIGYLVCTLCAGLSFIILDSNLCKNNMLIEKLSNTTLGRMAFSDTCSLSQGGKSTIASTVLFFIAAVGNCLLHPAQVKKEEHESMKQGGDGLDEPLFTEESSVL